MTQRQRTVLHTIREHYERHGRIPKLREVQERLGMKSPQAVWQVYISLVDMKFMRATPEGYELAASCPCCGGRLAA